MVIAMTMEKEWETARILHDVLNAYPAAVRPSGPIEALGGAGGTSGSRLWRYRAASGQRLLLRAWPLGGPWDRPRLERIHGWLARSRPVGLTAIPIASLRGSAILEDQAGRWLELAPWLDGLADLRRPPPVAKLQAGFLGLAQLHRVWAGLTIAQPSEGLAQRLAELDEWRRFGFGELKDRLKLLPDVDEVRPARRWLTLAEPLAREIEPELRRAAASPIAAQPCLCDVHGAHLLFEGDRLTGIVDYGAMAIDNVARDLARLLAEWAGPNPEDRRQALDAYTTARPLSPLELRLIPLFERSGSLLSGGRWVRRRWLGTQPQAQPDPAASEGLGRSVRRLEELGSSGSGAALIF